MTRRLHLYLRHLLDFDSPRLESLVCTDLFVDGKSFLYVYWKIENGFKVKIKRFKTVYSSESTLVFKIPNNLTEIDLVYSNVWKKKKEKLFLSKLTIYDATLSKVMTDNFRPKQKPTVERIKISSLIPGTFKGNKGQPKLKNTNTSIKQNALTLKYHRYE